MFFRKFTKKESRSDQELIELYKNSGDLSFLGELFQRYTHLIFGVCLKYLKDEEESKDAVMQIFEKLVTTLKTHQVDNFKSWIHVLTKNHCLMVLRSSKARPVSLEINTNNDMEFNLSLHHQNEEVEMEELLLFLEKGLSELPEEQKKCLELFYLNKKCYQEITQLTGYDLKKVKSYIQNGKRNLKIFMEKCK